MLPDFDTEAKRIYAERKSLFEEGGRPVTEDVAAFGRRMFAAGLREAAERTEATCGVPAWIHEVEPCGAHAFATELRDCAEEVERG